MPVFYFILQPEGLGSQLLPGDHIPAASENVMFGFFFFPSTTSSGDQGDFLSDVYFDTLIPTSSSAQH